MQDSRHPQAISRLIAAAAVVAAVAGCGGRAAAPVAAPVTAASSAAPSSSRSPAAPTAVASGPQRAVSVVRGSLVVREAPSAGVAIATKLPPTTPLGSTRVLQVRQVRGDWVEVALPVRPNGSTGWVAALDVRLEPVAARIEIDLHARALVLTVDGRQLARTSVAIGSSTNPTPTGSFYVTDRVRSANPKGAYGPFALGLSAHSDTLSEFGGGDAQVGIHGTDQPTLIGQAVSHGCIRVPNDVAELLQNVPLGTPVIIT